MEARGTGENWQATLTIGCFADFSFFFVLFCFVTLEAGQYVWKWNEHNGSILLKYKLAGEFIGAAALSTAGFRHDFVLTLSWESCPICGPGNGHLESLQGDFLLKPPSCLLQIPLIGTRLIGTRRKRSKAPERSECLHVFFIPVRIPSLWLTCTRL